MQIHIRKLPGIDIEQEFYLVTEVDAAMKEKEKRIVELQNALEDNDEQYNSLKAHWVGVCKEKDEQTATLKSDLSASILRENMQRDKWMKAHFDGVVEHAGVVTANARQAKVIQRLREALKEIAEVEYSNAASYGAIAREALKQEEEVRGSDAAWKVGLLLSRPEAQK